MTLREERGKRSDADQMARIGGLLYPQQNQVRNVHDLSGLWRFQLDPEEEGEANGWFDALPDPRQIPVPCSWNDLFDDARNYLGLAWYQAETWIPSGWRGQRLFLRVGSANYHAKVWVNGNVVAEHFGGHLPFVTDITGEVQWEQPNIIAISVENEQLPERVPPGPVPGGSGIASIMRGFPATTYDFFPYAGLHRPVVLFSVPPAAHIDDITVVTSIDGGDGIVDVTVNATGSYGGAGAIRLGDKETRLEFRDGLAEARVRVPKARFWGPDDPYLYSLAVSLVDEEYVTDRYSLEIGIRTVEVRGDQLLLNGQPITLTGFGKHEDFPLTGRALNLPMWIRDHELMRWAGANSYRTSHYPYAEEAMRLADRLGVLVINETPAVGLNFNDAGELNSRRFDQCLPHLRELVARDKNHPSTIM